MDDAPASSIVDPPSSARLHLWTLLGLGIAPEASIRDLHHNLATRMLAFAQFVGLADFLKRENP